MLQISQCQNMLCMKELSFKRKKFCSDHCQRVSNFEMKKQTKQVKSEIPSWLFFAIYYDCKIGWTKEKNKLAEEILEHLKMHAEVNDWKIDKIIAFNKYDNVKGYMMESKHEKNSR